MNFIKSIKKIFLILIILISCLFPLLVFAKVFITTEIVTGQVISITNEYTIELDSGFLYYPAKKNIPISIKPGEAISIRYFIDEDNDRNYIEYAPGKNSLKPGQLPKSTTTSKKML
ncbi:MAG: hypothetical protein HOJ48_00460 [Desulfobacula sp.]|jgi:hypothetical protein|nr:hypothetical protein [Desulfobacula sp.]MBT7260861.1 hypothetical protein [Desulfobacula sp.]